MDCLVINGYVTGNTGLVIHRTLRSKMDDDAAREDACREYQSSLEDLTFNSKPHINMLTILAEENLQFAKDIVAIIEAQINKARTTEKLPVLYLVDSIVKNVGGEYLAVFTKNLVTSFICVFEKVDENIRKSLFKLRSTWDDIFPLKKLYALDVRVNAHDPAWPIKPLPPTVNASIHVNPKFLKQAEEVTSPKASPPQPVPPAPQPAPSISEASITQEQLIRQQLLSKQKQLLELQHKKIELELEQTKAQLAANVVLTLPPAGNPPALNTVVPKPTPPAPVIKPWIPSQADIKPPTRDPRLNRVGPQHKEQSGSKKDGHTMGVATHTPEKRLPEKSSKPERTRPPKKELFEEKPKAKSPSPMAKGVLAKSKHSEAENVKSADAGKKDPRLRKHQLEKGDPKEEEVVKEKKRCTEKKEKEEPIKASELNKAARGKLVNGSVGKHERSDAQEKSEVKAGGNARTNARKRTRSRSRSRSPSLPSQKRKERRSPKGRARSDSASPPPSHKLGKARQSSGKHAHAEDSPQHGKARDERATPKKSPSEPRRTKRSPEERHPEARDSQSPRTHSESKDSKENSHRWKSGWGENKHLKLSEEAHGKAGPQRHKSYPGSQRPTTPRTPKQHRLSVDANLQIPEVLNSVSKRDLLRKASIRLENGEISKDDFLNVAHQIKQLFQYQEEKQRSDSWEGSSEDGQKFPAKKKPLLSTPPSGQTQPDSLSDAELSYYEHKSRLRKTQLPQRQGGEGWDGEDSQEEGDSAAPAGGKPEGGRAAAHPSPLKFPRPPRDRHSKERAEEQQPPATMIEEYNHGREFPRLKSLQGLRFRRRADPRDPNASDCLKNEREWNSPLSERQRYDEREEQKSGYDAPRRYGGGPDLRHDDPLKHGRLPPSLVHRSSASSSVSEGPARKSPVVAYERERLSPLEQQDAAGLSPVPRFESPTSEHSDDGPLELPRPILKRPPPGPLAATRQLGDSPGHTPPHAPEGVAAATGVQRYDGQPSRYDGPGRHHPPGRFDGGPGAGRFDGPGGSHGPNRYDGPPQQGPGRFDGPGRFEPTSMPQGPMRGGDPQGIGRYEGPAPSQGPGRYDAPVSQQPSRFDGPGPGPGGFDGHMQPKHFDGPRRFDNPHMQPGPGRFEGPMGFQPNPIPFDGPPNQSGPIRFDGPGNTPGPIRFDPPGQPGPMRFDMMHHQGMPQRFDGPPGQQGPPRFCGPPNMQPPLRPGGPMYDPMSNPGGPQQPQNFNMPNQRFPEPINPQFSAAPLPFSGQQNMPQGVNFNMPPGPNSSGFPNSFSQSGPPPFYTPGAPVGNMNAPPPTGNMQPQMNMLPNLGQPPFLPPNPVPFSQPAPQFRPPESHFGQVDVNDLLTKLISTGIIRPTKTETTATGTESTSTPPATPAVVEEEEEEEEQEEDDDVPDLTGFVIEDMKQRYDSVVTKLYTGIQCYSCGMRFTASQTDVYADHLDWHYRLNRSEKDISKKVTHRRWYYSQVDWIEFEEIADLEERAKSLFFEKVNEEVVQKTQEAAKEKEFQSVCAAADVVDESCEICQEPFEMYWEEEEEEWHLRNAIRVDEMTYHPSCFEDYKNTSSFLDCTPSPNKLLTENPLSAFVKREEEEQTSCCVAVKEEMESEAEEVTSPKASPPQPVPPAPQPAPSISEASITQEQLIRQQLLSKQKQLLELQHKKIELELEQTKAQLAANVVLTLPPAGNPPALNTVVPKPTPPAPVIKPWIPSQADIKPPTRDPRLNRVGPQHKEQSGSKKDGHTMGVATHTPEKRLPEKSSKPERTRPPKKELFEEKPKAKSPSPMAKGVLAKSKHSEAENVKSADAGKKDPRLRKHQLEKGDPKEEEVVKEKKRCTEKKEKEEPIKASELNKAARGKLVNGSVGKHERSDAQEKSEVKAGGNARTNARKRTRSRSRSRSPSLPSQKRKERRSPKGRARSDSASPPPSHKLGKARQSSGKHAHAEDSPQHGKARDERATPKKSPSEPRRTKRSPEERHPEARDSQSPRTHSESKDSKENSHRWKSGWGENKHLKLSEEAHGKAGPQRHKSYPGSQRPTTPRTPKQHRLSVDANLQIPEVLNSVSKRDLLRKASIRLENGEISKDDFLNVAHQIKQLFQYQEEKQRSDSWEGSSEDGQKFPAKKKPLLSTPPSGQTQPDSLSDAELSYYEHKSRLRKTQLPQRQGGEGWDGEDSQEEGDSAAPAGGKPEGGRAAAHPSPLKFPRPPRDRHSKERAEEQQPPATMIEEYNHGREFPRLKSLQGLRFRRRADPRDPNASDCLKNEREWNSPLSERQRYDEREEQKSGYDAPRRYGGGPDLRHDDPLKHGRLPPSLVHRSSASSSVSEGPARKSPVVAYERERLSPLEQQDAAGLSPVPRFESPTSEHSDDGPLELPRPILKRPPPGPLAATRQLGDSPGHTPPHAPEGVAAATGVQRYDGQPSRYDGPGRHHPPGRFDGGPGAGRFDGPGGSHGPNRYDGPPQQGPGRFDGPGRFEPTSMPQGPMRGGDPQGIGRYEGPAPSQGPGRYDAPVSQQPSRFDGPGPGPGGFDGHMQPKHFDGPRRFDNPHMQPGPGRFEGPMGFQPNPIPFDGPPNQSGPIRFDGPGNTPGPIRFDPPGQPGPMRFDMMHHQGMPQRFDGPPGQQGPPRFCGPPNMQPPLRPGGPMYDPMSNPGGPQQPQNFNMPNQRFPEPINPQFSAAPLPFSGQQNMPQGVNFNMPPGPNSSGFPNSFSQSGPPPFYTPGAPVGNMNAPPPTGNMQPQMNMLPNLGQPPFLPPNPVPFSQPAPQFRPPESHFGQVDVNDLLTKLISTGIIRPTKTETTATGTESTSTPPATPAVVEEEEEEEEQEEDDDVPDLTGFVIEDMKQRYDSVVTKLYTGIQCYSCGMRFTASQTDVYADHLDWHYRLNRSEKDISKKVTHRRWYYSQVDWIEFEEIADLEERAKSLFFEKVNEEVVQKTQEAAKEKEFQSVCAAADVVDESCEICQEPFEMYWEEEEEEWHLRNAIRVDEMTYHPSCFEDYKNTSSFLDCTPSPNKLLTENPLSAFVKREEEEQTSCCVAVKEEMESEVGVTQNLMEEIQVKMEEEVQVSAIS